VTQPWWRTLLRHQQDSGFEGIAGAQAAVTLPVSDRLVSSIVAERIPPTVPLAGVDLRAEGDNRFAVRGKLKSPVFLPPFTVRFTIVGQPHFPDSPFLTCVMSTHALAPLMGTLVRLFARLPSWVAVDRDRVRVDLRRLASAFGVADLLAVVEHLEVTTSRGAFVVSARVQVPPRGAPSQ
jgi:hypothetical protein